MSGICGIINYDGAPVDPKLLRKMAEAAAYRGPDGIHYWIEGNVGLAHLAMNTTPESVRECQPLVSQRRDLVLTADARVDNREELIKTLETKGCLQTELPTDADIILAAYECWGEDCPKEIIGDFAFSIWNAREQTLFCTRDHMGVRSLFYHANPAKGFVFGTEIKMLFPVPWVPRYVDEDRVVQVLSTEDDWDKFSTFYRDIFNLPPAHAMKVKNESFSQAVYWQLDLEREIHHLRDELYVEEFREIFFEAVRCRLRSTGEVGSFLSGGLDSSSIACTARKLLPTDEKIHTFSIIFDSVPASDEREYMQVVLDQGGFKPHFVHGDEVSPFMDFGQNLNWEDQPNLGPNMFLHCSVYQQASHHGLHVLLDGLGGDQVAAHGIVRITELAHQGKWLTALKEAKSYTDWRNLSLPSLIYNRMLIPVIPAPLQRIAIGLRKIGKKKNKILDHPREWLRKEHLRRDRQVVSYNILDAKQNHYQHIMQAANTSGLSLVNYASSAVGIESRYPFFDIRLIEYCLALPSEQKMSSGKTRLVLRRAMKNTLPEEIQWRPSKGNLSYNYRHQLLTKDRETIDWFINTGYHYLDQFSSTEKVREASNEFIRTLVSPFDYALFLHYTLAIWLEKLKIVDEKSF